MVGVSSSCSATGRRWTVSRPSVSTTSSVCDGSLPQVLACSHDDPVLAGFVLAKSSGGIGSPRKRTIGGTRKQGIFR